VFHNYMALIIVFAVWLIVTVVTNRHIPNMDSVRYVKYRSDRSHRSDYHFEHDFGHFLRTIVLFPNDTIVRPHLDRSNYR
jgi:hypothetical protein